MADFAAQVRKHRDVICRGSVLAIDPASGGTSAPGWAAYSAGKYRDGGVLDLGKGPVQQRLYHLYEMLSEVNPDVVVIERIRGSRAHEYLHWAVGVVVASCHPKVLLEMPVTTWKKHAGAGHVKGDAEDARAIGDCLLALAGV